MKKKPISQTDADSPELSKPIELYKKAFFEYAGDDETDLLIKPYYSCVLFKSDGITYGVAHVDDLRKSYKGYFDRENYDEIYLESNESIWNLVAQNADISATQWITSIYRQWTKYWHRQKEAIVGGEERYEQFRRRSWEDLQVLFDTIKIDHSEVVTNSVAINEGDFLSIIAMAIKAQFENEEDFYDEIISVLTDNPHLLTFGDTYESIFLDIDEDDAETFLLYNPLHNFEDYSLEPISTYNPKNR